MRDRKQYTLDEQEAVRTVRQAYPGAGPWFLEQAVRAEVEKRRQQDRDRAMRRVDLRQGSLL